MSKRIVYTAKNGDKYIDTIMSGLSNIGSPDGIEWFKTHKGIKAVIQIGYYRHYPTKKGVKDRRFIVELELGK